jgi:hypothetical protein
MEPISTAIMVVQGVGTIIKGIRSFADEANKAVGEINKCVESGKKLKDSMAPIGKFFSAAGKYESARLELEEAKEKQDKAIAAGNPVADAMSDAEYVMEMMSIDRQIKQHYDDIKHYFIYHFDEAGLWDDFWSRLSKLRADREAKAEVKRREETEKRLAIIAEKMRIKRQRQKVFNVIYNCVGGFVITFIIAGFAWFIRWMFEQGAH